MAAGRPTEYNIKICQEICDQVAEGANLKTVLNSKKKYPAYSTWRRWKLQNEELRILYVNAQQDKVEAFLVEIDEIMQDLKSGKIDASSANVLIQTLKWKLSKFYPKMFGDRVDHDITTNGKDINLPEWMRLDKK